MPCTVKLDIGQSVIGALYCRTRSRPVCDWCLLLVNQTKASLRLSPCIVELDQGQSVIGALYCRTRPKLVCDWCIILQNQTNTNCNGKTTFFQIKKFQISLNTQYIFSHYIFIKLLTPDSTHFFFKFVTNNLLRATFRPKKQ